LLHGIENEWSADGALKLWRLTLDLAYRDAVADLGDARRYLTACTTEQEKALRYVCGMAGVDADRVIRCARNRYGSNPASGVHVSLFPGTLRPGCGRRRRGPHGPGPLARAMAATA
jgi:hypothetical protein